MSAGARAVPIFMVAAGLLAGCGWAEWPPPGSAPTAANPPPTAAKQSSDTAFINAGAVVAGKGDTVYTLSRRHRVSMGAIINANGLKPPYHLKVGQRIVLPRDPKHVVERGDTLYGVSRHYGVGMDTLARANGLKAPYTIVVGQRLRIPQVGPRVGPQVGPRVGPQVGPRAGEKIAQAQPRAKSKGKPAPQTPPRTAVPSPPPKSGKGFLWPARGRVVSNFGPKAKGLHNDGINISAPRGAPVRAAENGVVAYAGNELRGFGNLLLVKHSGGWITAYAHNQDLLVRRGEKVSKGQAIAKIGSTGSVTSPQLHFEIRKGKRAIDPRKYLTSGRA